MASRFASLTEQDIEKIVEDKDSQNTKSRPTKVAKELFADYVKEKNLRKRWFVLLHGEFENPQIWLEQTF